MPEKPPKVFLSHNSRDKPWVAKLADRLADAKIEYFFDDHDILAGEAIDEAVEKNLAECDLCLFLLGSHGLGPWHNEEIRSWIWKNVSSAGANKRGIITVLLPGATRELAEKFLPTPLHRRKWIEFPDGPSDEMAFNLLVRSIRGEPRAAVVADRLTFRNTLHQIPPRPPGFVGREEDLVTLRALNASAGAMIAGLRGMGGIGKTALAIVLAHEWAARFPDAQLFLDARGTEANPPSAGDLLAQVIQTFHPTAKLPDEDRALKGVYHDVLAGKKVLIVLDNARDAAQAAPLIPPTGSALIVTSRHSFMLGTTKPHAVGTLPDVDAVALLREFYGALGDADAAALAKLCAGLPLALRLAGAHVALDAAERGGAPNVGGYMKSLGGGRLAKLDSEAADAGEVTISETLRLSEAQLSEAERKVWRALGVFTSHFDLLAAQAVAGANETMLDNFVRRSLLERDGTERFKVHEIAADYARAQLTDIAADTLHLAHAAHYIGVGSQADDLYLGGKPVDALALFDCERAQIEAAYTWLTARRDESAARQMIALVNAVVYVGALRFHPRQSIAWLESQLRAARSVEERRAEGNALCNLGNAHANLGDARKAIQYYEMQLVIAREIGDRLGEGNALGNLGVAHAHLGDARKAIEYYEMQLVIAREIGDRLGEGNALGNLGSAHRALVDTRKAIEYLEQALVLSREIGNRRAEGNALCNLGNAHANLGDARKAIQYYEMQLAIAREIGDRRGEGYALWNSALQFWKLENRAEAVTRAETSLTILEAIESPAVATVRAALVEWRAA